MKTHGYTTGPAISLQRGLGYKAEKGGKTFFLKQYKPYKPDPDKVKGATYEKKLRKFEKMVDYHQRLNAAIQAFTGLGGNIIVPEMSFVDHICEDDGTDTGVCAYFEATEYLENKIEDEELDAYVRSAPLREIEMILKTASGAMATIHQHGIVHSDLKPGNIVLVRNASGKVVTKIMDFDGSYFMNDRDTSLSGDEAYCSPELYMLLYAVESGADAEVCHKLRDALTEKSDIFSLGLIFHQYLAGGKRVEPIDLPPEMQRFKDEGKPLSPALVVLRKGQLRIDDSVPNLKLKLLLADMLQLDPALRPSAKEVLDRLKDSETGEVFEEAWPAHRLVVNTTKIKEAGYVIFKRSGTNAYELVTGSGERKVLEREEMLSLGFATERRPEGFCTLWPEHGTYQFNEPALRAKGFVSAEREEKNGKKGYRMYRADGTSQLMIASNMLVYDYLVSRGSAPAGTAAAATRTTPTPPPSPARPAATAAATAEPVRGICEPWEEHRIRFVPEALASAGVVGVERAEAGGKRGYYIYKEGKPKKFMLKSMVLAMEYAVDA